MADAEVAKISDDNDYAIEKFSSVLDRCKQFPDKTTKITISATFHLAKCLMDAEKVMEAKPHFEKAASLLCAKINSELGTNKENADLVKDSIFDTDTTKAMKE